MTLSMAERSPWWRTRGGRVVHFHDCPVLARTENKLPWIWAADQDEDTLLSDKFLRYMQLYEMRFCGRCLSWHADMLAEFTRRSDDAKKTPAHGVNPRRTT